MSIEIRPITPDEFPSFVRVPQTAFGHGMPSDEEMEMERAGFEYDRSVAAFEDGHILGTAGAYSFQLTLPGLTQIAAAGVSWVSVLPTARRRGIFRQMMTHQLTDIQQRGEALAILYASESLLYSRFGYGAATTSVAFEIDPKRAGFRNETTPEGLVRLVDTDEARRTIPDIYDQARRQQPGELNRSHERWDNYFRDPERWRDGMSARFYLLYESSSGHAEGYVSYRIREKWDQGLAQNILSVGSMKALTDEAQAALWQYCLSVDLVATVQAHTRPPDDPLRWMLGDPRRLRVTSLTDGLWIRLLDIPAALEARRYLVEGSLILEVHDETRPETSGCYYLDGSPDGATCRRTDREPDLILSVNDLGAVYLGGVSFTTLAAAGRIREQTPGGLIRASLMFASEHAPWCSTDF
jgi:predicted acetyltransferase